MKRFSALASAAALGFALTASGSAFAAPATPEGVLRDAQAQSYPAESFTKGGHRHGGHGRGHVHHGGGHVHHGGGHVRHGGYHRHYYRGYGGRGGAVAAGVLGGLAVGLVGAAIASQPPAPGPVVVRGDGRWINYCARKFGPSFDPASGTYLAADGYRYPCR